MQKEYKIVVLNVQYSMLNEAFWLLLSLYFGAKEVIDDIYNKLKERILL